LPTVWNTLSSKNMRIRKRSCALAIACLSIFVQASYAANEVLGELQLEGASKVEKTSGVWIDGQYLGYLEELKGSKKILLLPGDHKITVRQNGFLDFTQDVVLHPGEKQLLNVKMVKDTRFVMPAVTAEVKISVNPDRAAVFLDGLYVGHAAEFGGGLVVAPGHRKIAISLPGYQTFSTEVDLAPKQKFEIKTDLLKSGEPQMVAPEK
jgi:PEGA domain-containing protein